MATFASYVPFSELNDGTPSTLEEFRKEVAVFSRTRLLHLCSVVNALLRSNDGPVNVAAHDSLVKAFFEPDTARRLLKKHGEVRFVFHRQQVLFVAKTALLVCSEEGLVPDAAQFIKLGRAFLMAGDHLPKPGSSQSFTNLEDKFPFFAAQLLPTQEGSAFHRFDHKMARSFAMLTTSLPKLKGGPGPYWDIAVEFEKVTKIPLLSFQALLLGALTKFHEFDAGKYLEDTRNYGLSLQWFASTTVPPETVSRFLDLISGTPDQYREFYAKRTDSGNNDFTALRDKPLFRDGDFLFLIDFAFLAEKFETAPFWIVHDSLDGGRRADFHAFWGQVFEQYGCDFLVQAARTNANAVYPNPQFADRQKGQVCDVIVVCGNAAAYIELKGATFTSQAKYSSDHGLLKQELEKKLVEEDGGAKAVCQLKRAVELTCSESPEEVAGLELGGISCVYPMVVTRDDIGSVLGVNAFLQVRFNSVVARKSMKKNVTPLYCMNAEDFERLSAYFDDTGLTDLLYAYYRAVRRRGDYFLTPYFATDGNDILREKGAMKPLVALQHWKELTETALAHLGLRQLE